MTKEQLATEIIRVKNEIKALDGERQTDPTSARWEIQKLADKNQKHTLEDRLAGLQNTLERKKAEKALKEKTDAFFATPEGADFKSETETAIEAKKKEWMYFDARLVAKIDSRIKTDLGGHWSVKRFNKGFVEIAVIDEENSKPDRREFFFGQEIEIRYDEDWGTPRFESGCCSCGGFDMEGGDTIGQRAMFYVGIGKLYSNKELVAFIKDCLKESITSITRFSKELDTLRNKLIDPFQTETEK